MKSAANLFVSTLYPLDRSSGRPLLLYEEGRVVGRNSVPLRSRSARIGTTIFEAEPGRQTPDKTERTGRTARRRLRILLPRFAGVPTAGYNPFIERNYDASLPESRSPEPADILCRSPSFLLVAVPR